MSREEFTREFAEMLDIAADQLHPETDLTSLPQWDSVAYLSAMVLIDGELSIQIKPEQLLNARAFEDILSAVSTAFQD